MKVMTGTMVMPVVITPIRTYTYIAISLTYAVPK